VLGNAEFDMAIGKESSRARWQCVDRLLRDADLDMARTLPARLPSDGLHIVIAWQ
jgi:hypothetical protein